MAINAREAYRGKSRSNKSRTKGIPGSGRDKDFPVGQPILKNGLRGGCITSRHRTLLPMGSFSMLKNVRGTHPGYEQRLGQIRQHETADGTNQAMSIFQFSKGRKTERHIFAQMSDGDILEASTAPPETGAGTFGDEIFSGSTGALPASWGVIRDSLLYSNGVDQHQIYAGESERIDKMVIVRATAAIPKIPEEGEDVTKHVTDGLTTTTADLSDLGDLAADFDCIFIKTKTRANAINWGITLANLSVYEMKLNYYNGAWTNVTITDGTAVAGATLGQDGAMEWTMPSDEKPCYLFGEFGWWYQVYVESGGSLDATTSVYSVTFDGEFQDIVNLWDGVPVDIIESQKYANADDSYLNYAASMVDLSEMTTSDKNYFSTYDNIIGVYIDVGATPNVTAATTVNGIYIWTGTAFTACANIVDGTEGLSKSGWVTWDLNTSAQQTQFNGLPYYAYWFYFTVDKTLSADITCSMRTMPYFDITDIGTAGVCNAVWKDRALYTYDDNVISVSASGQPQVLNGADFSTLEAGDGRSNRVLCMRKFHNELMVWQEEKGKDGGCLTLFQGYNPASFGKLVLSAKIGILNSKCAAVVDGSTFTTNSQTTAGTAAFSLSHYGVFGTDGKTVVGISDDIQNYFDPTKTECIRRGYEDQMWLEYDSAYHVLRLGLVSGSTATTCNVFPVLDLTDMVWYFDELTPSLSCMTEVEAESGTSAIVQLGGGAADGYVYLLNTGLDDQGSALDSYMMIELQLEGINIQLLRLWLRTLAKETGKLTLTPYLNGLEQGYKEFDMSYIDGNEDMLVTRRCINFAGMKSTHISLKIAHNKADESFAIQTLLLDIYGDKDRGM